MFCGPAGRFNLRFADFPAMISLYLYRDRQAFQPARSFDQVPVPPVTPAELHVIIPYEFVRRCDQVGIALRQDVIRLEYRDKLHATVSPTVNTRAPDVEETGPTVRHIGMRRRHFGGLPPQHMDLTHSIPRRRKGLGKAQPRVPRCRRNRKGCDVVQVVRKLLLVTGDQSVRAANHDGTILQNDPRKTA